MGILRVIFGCLLIVIGILLLYGADNWERIRNRCRLKYGKPDYEWPPQEENMLVLNLGDRKSVIKPPGYVPCRVQKMHDSGIFLLAIGIWDLLMHLN
jgi:hypothetical protein